MTSVRLVLVGVTAWAIAASDSLAQHIPSAPAGVADKLRVFVACDIPYCDDNFLRSEITFVDWVGDRTDADVQVLPTAQQTAGGGWAFTFTLLGRGRFEGETDTTRYTSRADDVQLTIQQGMTRALQLALVPFVVRTPSAERLRISLAPRGGAESLPADSATTSRDRWDFWVFRTSLSGNFNGEKQTSAFSLYAALSAARTTEAWKIRLNTSGNFRRNRFDLPSGERFIDTTYGYGAGALVVKSVGPQWASGFRASINSSTQTNQRLNARIAPAIEYNLYPYAESARRQFTLQYSVGINSFDYREPTIYDRRSEHLIDEMLLVALDVKQPWGSLNMSLEAAHYFHDFDKYRAAAFAAGEVRLFRGFSLNLFASASRLHDQLYIARGTLRDEDVLLQRRQLETGYQYFGAVGITYRFGSIFDNIVNTRLDSRSGGPVFFFF